MSTGRYTQFAETLEEAIKCYTDDTMKLFCLALEKTEPVQDSPMYDMTFEMVSRAMFRSVQESLADHFEMAELRPLLDRHRPEIDAAAASLYQSLSQVILLWQARLKALEIARKSVETLLAEVLPGLKLGCTYTISGDKVHLDLTKTLKASVDLPLQELSEYLSDTARIEAALEAAPTVGIEETRRPPRMWSPSPINISYH